jgi:hypothetical protein
MPQLDNGALEIDHLGHSEFEGSNIIADLTDATSVQTITAASARRAHRPQPAAKTTPEATVTGSQIARSRNLFTPLTPETAAAAAAIAQSKVPVGAVHDDTIEAVTMVGARTRKAVVGMAAPAIAPRTSECFEAIRSLAASTRHET